MSIIKNYQDGKTELNKLKFKGNMGSGHPGSPPLIQKRVPTESKEASFISGTGLSKRLDDVGRISQLFARREGLGFLSNNTTLNLTIPQSYQIRGADSLKGAISNLKNSYAASGLALPNAIKDTTLTLASTLASIPVAGTGTHFVKGALGLIKYLDQEGVTLNNPNFPSKMERRADALPYKGADARIKSHFYKEPFDFGVTRVPGTPPDFVGDPKDWKNKSPKKTDAHIKLGDQGATKVKYDSDRNYYFKNTEEAAVDKVNVKYPFTNPDDVEPDYITFLFEILTPEEDKPSSFLQFRAFIESFDDSYTGNWNSYNYVGRGESFYTYNSFNRGINLSFKSAVATREELVPVYKKLNLLASTTAPSYSTNGIMRGTIVRMTVGNYVFDQPGFLSSVNYTWNTSYQWEIEGDQLPHALDCSVSFTPIHTFTPQTLLEKYIATNETI